MTVIFGFKINRLIYGKLLTEMFNSNTNSGIVVSTFAKSSSYFPHMFGVISSNFECNVTLISSIASIISRRVTSNCLVQ